jgi:hypothetical protein
MESDMQQADLPDESTLVAIWKAVLRNPDVDAGTSFLDAGGSSITAVRLRARLRDECGLDVDVVTLVDNPSPDDLLLALEEAAGAA